MARKDDYSVLTHCPTPSKAAIGVLEAIAVKYGYPIYYFDAVAAFPHADEQEEVFLRPPEEL
eukprot:3104814-Lingulodinium_polyedra.AAC.1